MGIIGQFDQIFLNIVEKLPNWLHPFMVFITNAGSPIVCILVLVVLIIWTYFRTKRQLIRTEAFILFALPAAFIIKELTKRIRPDTVYVENMLIHSYSFPSAHAYVSLLVLGFIAYLVWKFSNFSWKWLTIIALWIMVILVGLSRVYLGAHFPSDVLGGWILGFIALALTTRFAKVLSLKNV